MNLTQRKFKILVITLLILLIPLGFAIYQLFYASSLSVSGGISKSMAFAWSPMQQKIVNGTLWINVSWTWQTENFSMTVKINDDDFHYLDCLGFVFDTNHNGVIESLVDIGWGLFPYNQYWPLVTLNKLGDLTFPSVGRFQSDFHTCTFTNETGYEFKISSRTPFIDRPTLVHLCFRDMLSEISGDAVYIEFEVRP